MALLADQADRFRPAALSMETQTSANALAATRARRDGPPVAWGAEGLLAVAARSGADIIVAATDGLVALHAVLAALEAGIDVALANKELAVAAGEPLFAAAKRSGARIVPVDSEHSAIAQCIAGERAQDVVCVVVTASGGPCYDMDETALRAVTPEVALRHPTWAMGQKNSLDSATLMNKGLEIIEATHFFGLRPAQLDVVVQRQSVVHALVFFADGSVKAQLAAPDMRLPISYALGFPERLASDRASWEATRRAVGLVGVAASLTFEPVDHARFPALRLAYRAAERGGTHPAALSAANEEAGRAFLQGKIRFVDIAALVAAALDEHQGSAATLPEIVEADRWARAFTRDAISAKL